MAADAPRDAARPASHTEAVREHFDREAGQYSAASVRGLWRIFREVESSALLDLLAPQPGERILDAGSGAGFYTERLKAEDAEVTALDLSGAMLADLRARLDVETIEGDLTRVDLEPRWDKVLCAGALEFVDDPPAAVARLARALDPAGPGRIVLLVPRGGLVGAVYRAFHRRHGFRVNLFSRAAVAGLARAAGEFRIDTLRPVTFNLAVCLQREEVGRAGGPAPGE